MKCEYCGKNVSLLNKFYLEHGKANEWDMDNGKIIKTGLVWCSKKCFKQSQKPEETYY